MTEAVPLPEANEVGLTEQVVWLAAYGREHDRLTCEAKPLCGVTEIVLVKVAVWPAATVCVVLPEEVMEKSGGPVTVKLTGTEVPPGVGSIT